MGLIIWVLRSGFIKRIIKKVVRLAAAGFTDQSPVPRCVRSVFVRTEANTRGHVLEVIPAYLIVRKLQRAWKDFDLTVKKGLEDLNRPCAVEVSIKAGVSCRRLPSPAPQTKALLDALDVNLPPVLPKSTIRVDTKKKLPSRRK